MTLNTLTLSRVAMAALLALTACSSQPQFDVDFSPTFSFAELKTYRWYDDVNASQLADYRQYNSSDKRVRTYIDRELLQKGFDEVGSGNSDFLVNYHISREEHMQIDNFTGYPSAGMHGGVGVGTYGSAVSLGYSSGPSVKRYKEGTVVIDIIDAGSGKIVWRSIVEGRLPQSLSIREKDSLASRLAREIMADFPPE